MFLILNRIGHLLGTFKVIADAPNIKEINEVFFFFFILYHIITLLFNYNKY